jgi:hypothetical protein
MQTRCYRCGWSYAIKQDEIVAALQALEAGGGVHYDARCPRCRHINKLSIEMLRRAAPRPVTGAASEEPGAAEGPSSES